MLLVVDVDVPEFFYFAQIAILGCFHLLLVLLDLLLLSLLDLGYLKSKFTLLLLLVGCSHPSVIALHCVRFDALAH